MKRILFVAAILLMMAAQVNALTYGAQYYMDHRTMAGAANKATNPLYLALNEIEGALGVSNAGTGNFYYVDSACTTPGDGTSWDRAKTTLDAAVVLCTANNGDVIYVASGHNENWSTVDSADLDVAGITVIGCGTGTDMPRFDYDDSDPEVVIGAANITIYNLAFQPSTNQTIHAIEIEADADGSRIIGCWFMNGESSGTDEFIDAVQPAALADNITVQGCIFESYGGTGANTAIDLTAGVNKNWRIIGNYFEGDYAEAPIYSDDDTHLRMYIAYNTCRNTNSGDFGIEFQNGTSATGTIAYNVIYTDALATALDPGSMTCVENYAINTVDLSAVRVPVDPALSAQTWTAGSANDILNKLMYTADGTGNYPASVAQESALSYIMGKGGSAAASTFVNTTDSLEAIADHVQGLLTTAGGTGNYPTGITDDTILAYIMGKGGTASASTFNNTTDSLEAISDAIGALTGVGLRGVCETDAVGATEFTSIALAGYGNDYFNSGWVALVTYDAGGVAGAPEGEIRDIVDYVSATGVFTVGPAFSAQVTLNDKVMLLRVEDLNPGDSAILGSSNNIWYVNSAIDSTPSTGEKGRTWDTAYTTIQLAETAAAAGDVILVAKNHNENITGAADITVDLAGVSIIGMGEGNDRPLIDFDDGTAVITLDNAGIKLANLRFRPGATAVAIGVRVEDAGIGCVIENCAFVDGEAAATDEFTDAITVDTLAADLIVRNCTYFSTGTDCGTFVNLDEATIANPTVEGCIVYGGFAEAPIWAAAAIPTNVNILNNIITNTTAAQFAIEFQGAATGICAGNWMYTNAYATMLDPGSMMCLGNLGTIAINEQAIAMPISADTSAVTEVSDGSDLERLEYLQNKSDDILAGIRMAGGTIGDVYYVDAATGAEGSDGTTWEAAEALITQGIADCTANKGDIVFVAPGHTEALAAAQVTINTVGVTIIGIGDGTDMPIVDMQNAASSWDVTASSVTIKNINFHSSAAATAICLDIDAPEFTIENCLFTDIGDFEFAITIDLGATAENTTIRNCRLESLTGTTGATDGILIGGVVDRLIIEDCHIWGNFSNAGIYSTQINTNALIKNNSVTNNNSGNCAIEFTGATTGDLINNKLSGNTYGSVLDPGSMRCFGNMQTVAIDTGAEDVPLVPGKSYMRYKTSGAITATDQLFTVTGSPIIVTSCFGLATTAIGGACTLNLQVDATAAGEDYDLTTDVDIQTVDQGGMIVFSNAILEGVTTPAPKGATGCGGQAVNWLVVPGDIESDSAGDTGAITWYIVFTPVGPGCEVIPVP